MTVTNTGICQKEKLSDEDRKDIKDSSVTEKDLAKFDGLSVGCYKTQVNGTGRSPVSLRWLLICSFICITAASAVLEFIYIVHLLYLSFIFILLNQAHLSYNMEPRIEKACKKERSSDERKIPKEEAFEERRKKTIGDLPYDCILQIFKMIDLSDVHNCRLLNRRIYGIAKEPVFRMEGDLYVILFDQQLITRVQDKFGKYGRISQTNDINELWRFSGRPIEHLKITFTKLTKEYCTHLLGLIKMYNIKVRDMCIWFSGVGNEPNMASIFLIIKELQPQTLLINDSERYQGLIARIFRNAETMERLKAFLITASSFNKMRELIQCSSPSFYVEHPDRALFSFVDVISCVKNKKFEEFYDRYPASNGGKFKFHRELR